MTGQQAKILQGKEIRQAQRPRWYTVEQTQDLDRPYEHLAWKAYLGNRQDSHLSPNRKFTARVLATSADDAILQAKQMQGLEALQKRITKRTT